MTRESCVEKQDLRAYLPTVSHEDVFEVFMALMSLQNLEVYAIRRLEDGDLINEE